VQVAHFECALAHLQMYCFSQLGDSEVAHFNRAMSGIKMKVMSGICSGDLE